MDPDGPQRTSSGMAMRRRPESSGVARRRQTRRSDANGAQVSGRRQREGWYECVGWPISGQQDTKPPEEARGHRALPRHEPKLAPLQAVVVQWREDSMPLLLRARTGGVRWTPGMEDVLPHRPLRMVVPHKWKCQERAWRPVERREMCPAR